MDRTCKIELYHLRFRFSGVSTRVRDADISKACIKCFSGAVLTTPVVIRFGSELKGRPLVQAGREWLIEEKLKAGVRSAELKGARFNPSGIDNPRGNEATYFELTTNTILPPLSRESRIDRANACPACGQGGFYETAPWTDEVLAYEMAAFDSIPLSDFYLTYEFWGDLFPPGKPQVGSIFPGRRLVVSGRVKTFLEKQKVRGMIFQEIMIIDP